MAVLESLLAVVLPVGLLVLAGALWARFRPGPLSAINEAVFYLFVPALVYDTLSRTALTWDAVAAVSGAAIVVSLGCALAAAWWFRNHGQPRPALILACAVPNNGNMGMSLSLFAFGQAGLALGTAYYVATTVVCFTLGIQLMTQQRGRGLREVFLTPLPYALGLGLTVHALQLHPPLAIGRATQLLGQAAIPCMLLSLGHRLATTPLGAPAARHHRRLAIEATVLRVVLGLGLGLLYTSWVPMSPLARKVALVQASMPTAVITTVLAERYDRQPALAAVIVALSTLTSLALLPLLLAYLD